MNNGVKLKKFREINTINFMKKYYLDTDFKLSKGEKIKLCSSDDFNNMISDFDKKICNKKSPTIVSNVGGFYVSASLIGRASNMCASGSKPYVIFLDKKSGNMQNAIYNSFLIQSCSNKEDYLFNLFGLNKCDVIKAFRPSTYYSFIEDLLKDEYDSILNKEERKRVLKVLYEKNKEKIDKEILDNYITDDLINEIIEYDFNLKKLEKYLKNHKYNSQKHLDLLLQLGSDNLSGDNFVLFSKLAKNMTEYLANNHNYNDLVKYLIEDIKLNSDYHILANNDIYDGYKKLFLKNSSTIKFAPGIDLSTKKGLAKFEEILKEEHFISDDNNQKYPIDIAFIPHINTLKEVYPIIKKNVQDYVSLYKDNKNTKNYFVMNSTATLDIRTLDSIGGSFIDEEKKNHKKLKNLSTLSTEKGFPLLMFMAGANYGNIYHSEIDTQNMIDMAIQNNVDTVYIGGLIYSTYFHTQTSRRLLTHPDYETLSSRLVAARNVIKKLNDAGIKVVYQMGDEEYHLYEDIFKIYVREQGVIGNDFLKREDLRSKYDWVRPIIIQELIPYLLRSGEDIINLYTDEASKTSVSKVCHALKRYVDGLPLGDLEEYINPEYLKDTDKFKVVYSLVDKKSETDDKISVNLMSNPNSSIITQYANPRRGANKQALLTGNSQLNVDEREGHMSVSYLGDKMVMTVPQMINDEYYIKHPELLKGIKEHVKEDPTFKRVTQVNNSLNYPGGYIITGDIREKMIITPYFKRARELMEYVQKTGRGMPLKVEGKINDWQIGSLTERPWYDVKFMDYLYYDAGVTSLAFNGDLQQGFNYGSFANECRHLSGTSVTQQMVSNTKLIRPYLRKSFGIIDKNIVDNSKDVDRIINHLASFDLIKHNSGIYGNFDIIKRDVDYKTVDLKLPNDLKKYESIIRDKLSKIVMLDSVDIVEGNHEKNSDWDNKGYSETEILRQELCNLKEYTGSDTDIIFTEYQINHNGDLVNASSSLRTINGYTTLNAHNARKGGSSITAGANKWLSGVKESLPNIDIIDFGHYHVFESAVMDNTLINCTGCGVGQSAYDLKLGYAAQPIYVLKRYLPDGRIQIETIGKEFLDAYEVQNPYIKEKGLDKFISECMTEDAVVLDNKIPSDMQKVYQRKLMPKVPKVIGPKLK